MWVLRVACHGPAPSVHIKPLCVNPRVRALPYERLSVSPYGLLVQPRSVAVPPLKENNGD